MSLLQETIDTLKENEKTPEDVVWVGSVAFGSFNWAEFTKLANIDYYDSFGSQEIAKDLLVVGKDWWLERHEYDGSEWWEYKDYPKQPDKRIPTTLLGCWSVLRRKDDE